MVSDQKQLQALYTDTYYKWQWAKKDDHDPGYYLEVLNLCSLLMKMPPPFFTDNKPSRDGKS